MAGPLSGIRIVEMAGVGPGPFCAMMLADHGAEVIRVERPGAKPNPHDPLLRSRTSIEVDLKTPEGRREVIELCRTSDGLVEGFRPGVMEKLGLGPDILFSVNPALVYGRMTGWGQEGPLAAKAGHDINYIAVSGVLGCCGRPGEKPTPPMNLIGDFGGGGMLLAFGMVSALLAVKASGAVGQVVDCAMTDGSALLMAMIWGYRAAGRWNEQRGTNLLDGAAPFYDTYETQDGLHVAIGAIEPQFYAELRRVLSLETDPLFDDQREIAKWPAQKARLEQIFRSRTRAEWCRMMEDADACFAPINSMTEALGDEHNQARETFIDVGGVWQPAPAPRYSGTPCAMPMPLRRPAWSKARC